MNFFKSKGKINKNYINYFFKVNTLVAYDMNRQIGRIFTITPFLNNLKTQLIDKWPQWQS